MSDLTSDSVTGTAEQTVNDTLGIPDFSDLIDDDEVEITSSDISEPKAKAQSGLKPSYAIRKFMPMVFAVIAKRRGEHWMLDEEEVDEMAVAVDECMEHYYPDAPDLPPWAMLVFAGGSIMLPRIMMDDLSDDEKKLVHATVNEQLNAPDNTQPDIQQVGHNTVLRPKAVP